MKNRNKKKILFLINNLKMGGAQRSFINQINYLSRNGHDVCLALVFKVKSKNEYLSEVDLEPSKIIVLDFKRVFDLKAIARLLSFISANNIGIIYSTLENANIIARITKILRPSLKIFIREGNVASIKSWKLRFFDVFFNSLVEKIIAVSRGVEESLLKYQKIYKKKIVVLDNSVVLPKEKNIGSKNSDELVLLNVGSLTEQKKQFLLLEIFKKLVKEDRQNNYRMYIVGEGGERDKLFEYIKGNDLESLVTLTGFLRKEEIVEYYINSDIFLLSSYWEGFPNVLLEAMSFAMPVLSFNIEGAVDVIIDGKSGYLVNKGDTENYCEKIIELSKDRNLRKVVGLAARERVKEKYTIEKQVDKLLKIISKND